MKQIPTDARETLGAAQFVLGPDYADWLWRERGLLSIAPPKASSAWPFRRSTGLVANVVLITAKRKP